MVTNHHKKLFKTTHKQAADENVQETRKFTSSTGTDVTEKQEKKW